MCISVFTQRWAQQNREGLCSRIYPKMGTTAAWSVLAYKPKGGHNKKNSVREGVLAYIPKRWQNNNMKMCWHIYYTPKGGHNNTDKV